MSIVNSTSAPVRFSAVDAASDFYGVVSFEPSVVDETDRFIQRSLIEIRRRSISWHAPCFEQKYY